MKRIKFSDIIIFENDNYIVVNKPPLLATLEDRASNVNLLSLAKEYVTEAQACHRLDKETSGALLFAKNPEAYRHASIQFEKREVTKIYHAVVDGIHDFRGVEVNKPLQIMGKGQVKINVQEGKDALTLFNTISAYKYHTLVECMPKTGRMHQIRVHLASLKASIVNDELYGGELLYLSKLKKKFNLKKWTEERTILNRFALHAFKLIFQDLNGGLIEVEAAYPKDFRVLVEQLEKNC